MSRGPGRVQRRIKELMQSEPSGAWTVEDLCDRVFEGVNRVEKKHRVSVIRALRAAVADDPDWRLWASSGHGGTLVLFNYSALMSYGLGWLKRDYLSHYRAKDPRTPDHWIKTEKELLEKLATENRHLVEPGGAWHQHVALHIAERDGDVATANELKKQQDAAWEKVLASFGRGR